MKISKIIGVVLILTAAGILISSIKLKKNVDIAFDKARNEILLTADGKSPGKVSSFVVSYIHSHGIEVVNAENLGREETDIANVELEQDDTATFLEFKKGTVTRIRDIPVSNNPVTVKIKSPFEGKMLFKYSVCGCEKIGPVILVFITVIVSLILTCIGLFLILSKGVNKKISDDS